MQTSTVQLAAKELPASHVPFQMHLLGRPINLAGMPGEGKKINLTIRGLTSWTLNNSLQVHGATDLQGTNDGH